MTAVARGPRVRANRPPTGKQLLILADRAERGPLTAAEADRLRTGILALDTARRSAVRRLADAERLARQLAAVADLVRRARYRRSPTVAVWALGLVLGAAQRPVAATGSGARVGSPSGGDAPSRPSSGP